MNIQNGKEEEEEKGRISQSSINSNPELKEKKVYFLRISLIIINIISLISGFYLYQNRLYYLSSEYKFDYRTCLFIFIILYSLGMIGTLLFSFLLAILLKIFIIILNLFNEESKSLIKGEIHSENSFRFINSNANEISLIPYAFTFFIIFTATLYLIGLPYSIFLLIFMNKNIYYSNFKDFALLYIFVIVNAIAGFILFYILLIIAFAKRDGSFRQRSYFIDDNNLNKLRNEIRGAMDKAEK